ncbi:galactokinase [Salisediminibacterium halotolerans]|uniref:Galactokinase n=1 Tax=Salisediminibacterium halotolerans TaxID=517425 RepID=A0A1H9QLU1_9BACI|nr:galactokinase [Salisediminibacterium haloalkalitolerans]SER61380.1 galactokinase [Salisediminibacterium haloalkalitolerans]
MKQQLLTAFDEKFGSTDGVRFFFAPGRVNLIGEHTDYNGGYVFPCALSVGTYVAVRPRSDRQVRLYSMNFPDMDEVSFSLDQLVYREEDDWANYPKGVMAVMANHGYVGKNGFEAVFYGNIPNGAGLSSSASIEVVTGVFWDSLENFNLDRVRLVQIAQEAENEFIGVNCGIMDQFAVGMGKKDHAMLLDCATLEMQYRPTQLGDYVLLIANTNKRRGLMDSEYNSRREECELALKGLQQALSIDHLCEITLSTFEKYQHLIPDETARRRARHAISENERTIEAGQSLLEGDLTQFGKLMNASHVSLRDDYEVTGLELDTLAEAAWAEETVIGARMTGAGFGGCTVNIVHKDGIDGVKDRIAAVYQEKTGLSPSFYVADVGEGAHEWTNQ